MSLVRCAYCQVDREHTSREFPSLIYAGCWWCAERRVLRDAVEWAKRPWWRRIRAWGR